MGEFDYPFDAEAIAEEVDADPAGDVSGAGTRVRTGIEKRSADQIAAIVLRRVHAVVIQTSGCECTTLVAPIDGARWVAPPKVSSATSSAMASSMIVTRG